MKSLNNKLLKITLLSFFSMAMFFLMSVKAYAWEAHLNENGDIEIYSVDKQKTSKIWYESIDMTITRCVYDPAQKQIHASSEYFIDAMQMPVSELRDGVYYTTHTIPIDEVIAVASSVDAAWGEEIRNAVDGTGPACYIKLDCIMYTNNEITGRMHEGPYINAPGVFGGDGYSETGISPSGVQIKNAYGWANPSGLATHYNHYLLIGQGVPPEPEENDDELVTFDYTMDHYANIDANQPAYAMSNYSSKFDLSQGIPSSEYIDNAFLADRWYGNTNVYARTIAIPYQHEMTYRWTVDEGSYQWIDTDGDGYDDTYDFVHDYVVHSEPQTLNIGYACVAFQYLSDTKIYDFTNADICNGAYDGDHIYYDDDFEVPMECIATNEYTDVASSGTLFTEEPNWKANTDDHVVVGTFTYPSYHDFGLVAGRPNIEAQMVVDIENIRARISNTFRTRNDRLVIDGHRFMNNEWVTGCNFFDAMPTTYRQCTRSSGWVNDYCLQSGIRPLHEFDPADVTGNVTVQIPPTVDNGYYYTSMKVFYQRLITYSKTVSDFESGE